MRHQETDQTTEKTIGEEALVLGIFGEGRFSYDIDPYQTGHIRILRYRLSQQGNHTRALLNAETEIKDKIRVCLEPETHHVHIWSLHPEHLAETSQHEVVCMIY